MVIQGRRKRPGRSAARRLFSGLGEDAYQERTCCYCQHVIVGRRHGWPGYFSAYQGNDSIRGQYGESLRPMPRESERGGQTHILRGSVQDKRIQITEMKRATCDFDGRILI
jgi:hypothetical protein